MFGTDTNIVCHFAIAPFHRPGLSIARKSRPFNDLVEINPTYQKEQNCKTYAYFTDIDKPFCGHPYILTIKEYDKLKFSDCFFARKFDIKKDKEVIRLIEERLLSQ